MFTNFVKTELFDSKKGKLKQFNPEWLFQSKENLEGLLYGLQLSDGSKEPLRESFDNTSLSIISAYKYLCLATDYGVSSMTIRDGYEDSRGYVCKTSYKLRVNRNAENAQKPFERIIIDDDYYYYSCYIVVQ